MAATSSSDVRLRAARGQDVPLLLSLITELAEYEQLAHEVVATEVNLHAALFGPERVAHAVIAQIGDDVAGFALYFFSFSTFLARPGLYLEDLFVRPAARGKGYGKALLRELARIAVERRAGRLEWAVLDWNAPSIAFYEGLGAHLMREWKLFRLTGNALQHLAEQP